MGLVLAVDWELRTQAGETPTLKEYVAALPEYETLIGSCLARFQSGDTQRLHSLSAIRQRDPTNRAGSSSSTNSLVRIGEYEILGEIARGGMGVVYKARHLRLKRLAAVKLIKSGEFADEAVVRRFQTEAATAATFDHPGIVPVFEVGEQSGQHFLAMAYIDGQSLWQRVKESPLEPKLAARLMQQVAEAVHYAHEHGIIHRDLKPQNILLAKNDQPKVTDFGLAKQQDSDSSLTETGDVLGTPSYMSPEQAAGKTSQVGALADVYSLGATLYCLLTGRPPFQAASKLETLLQVVEQEPVPPRQMNRSVPIDLETICLKCLQKEPGKRYASAAAIAGDLQRFQRGEPILARPVGSVERAWRWAKRHPFPTALIVTLVASAVTLGFLTIQLRSQVAVANSQTIKANQATADAKQATERAHQAAEKAERALEETTLAKHSLALRLAENLLNEGSAACELGRIDRGLLLYAEALRELPPSVASDAATQRLNELKFSIHANFKVWQPQLHVLAQLLPVGQNVIITPDGSKIIAAAGLKGLSVWDAATGAELGPLPGAHYGTTSLATDDEGRFVVAAGLNSREQPGQPAKSILRRWDLTTRQLVGAEVDCGHDFKWAVASADAKQVATFHHRPNEPQGTLKFWRFDGENVVAKEVAAADPVATFHTAIFNPDGSLLFRLGTYQTKGGGNVTSDSQLSVYESSTGRLIASRSVGQTSGTRRLISEGNVVALASRKRAWRLQGDQLEELLGEQLAQLRWRNRKSIEPFDETTHRLKGMWGPRGQPLYNRSELWTDPSPIAAYWGQRISADHSRVLTHSSAGLAVWQLSRDQDSLIQDQESRTTPVVYPVPDLEDADRVMLWTEVATGWTRNPAGEFVQLTKVEWDARRKRLISPE